MYKEELCRKIAERVRVPKVTVEWIINTMIEIICETMKNGEKITFTGFGTFEPRLMSPRVGRNPHTKEAVYIPARVRPVFKAAKALNDLFYEAPQITSLPPEK